MSLSPSRLPATLTSSPQFLKRASLSALKGKNLSRRDAQAVNEAARVGAFGPLVLAASDAAKARKLAAKGVKRFPDAARLEESAYRNEDMALQMLERENSPLTGSVDEVVRGMAIETDRLQEYYPGKQRGVPMDPRVLERIRNAQKGATWTKRKGGDMARQVASNGLERNLQPVSERPGPFLYGGHVPPSQPPPSQ